MDRVMEEQREIRHMVLSRSNTYNQGEYYVHEVMKRYIQTNIEEAKKITNENRAHRSNRGTLVADTTLAIEPLTTCLSTVAWYRTFGLRRATCTSDESGSSRSGGVGGVWVPLRWYPFRPFLNRLSSTGPFAMNSAHEGRTREVARSVPKPLPVRCRDTELGWGSE